MTEQCKHVWELIFKPDSFRRVRCKHCPEQMLDYDIERRLNATERLPKHFSYVGPAHDYLGGELDDYVTVSLEAANKVQEAIAVILEAK